MTWTARLSLALATLVLAAAPAAAGPLVLEGKVHRGDGQPPIADGVVVIDGGQVIAVGARGSVDLPADARVVALGDAELTPGLIDACSTAGVTTPESWAEHDSEVVPELRVLDAIDPAHPDFAHLAERGVTTVFVTAGPGSVIGSQGVVLKTAGPDRIVDPAGPPKATLGPEAWRRGARNRPPWMPAPTHDDGVWSWDPPEVESCCGLPADHVHEAAPETGPSRPGFGGAVGLATRRPTTRMGNVWVLRDALARAASGAMTGPAGDALRAVLSGSTRLRLQARSRGDIETALRLADEFGFQPILEEASEAHHLVDMLAARQVPVIFGPLFDAPTGVRAQTGETDEATVGTPRLLAARGVPFCLTAADRQGEDDLWGQALLAVRFGLSRDRALEAVTGAPARILGGEVARRLGKLEPGRDADIVVWSGAPLAPTSRPLAVLIDGELVAGALPTGIAAHHAKPAPAGRGDF